MVDGTRQPRVIQIVEIGRRTKLAEPLADGIVGQRRYPQTLYRTFHTGLLHHPPLYQLPLLAGIAAVDDLVGIPDQRVYYVELLMISLLRKKFYAEPCRQHREHRQRPAPPSLRVIVRLFQTAQMTYSPGDAVAVALEISVATVISPEYGRYIAGHTRFLSDAYFHFRVALPTFMIHVATPCGLTA